MNYRWEDYSDEPEIYVKQRPRPTPARKRKSSLREMKERSAEREDALRKGARPSKSREEVLAELVEESGLVTGPDFIPTFASVATRKNHMSNHEIAWITNYLGRFYEDQLITDVVRRVKGGKEATVYCCRASPALGAELVAGKVYHERIFRTLKNDLVYRQGRDIHDSRSNRGRREELAMKKRTEFGQQLLHGSWLESEFQTMTVLHDAGGDVPRPFARTDNAILMEYIGDERSPAPTLHHVRLRPEEARPLFDRLLRNVDLMLAHDRVHADLSAHNVLYWAGEVRIIDFPQAVDPNVNPLAFAMLARDVERLCQYFSRYGVVADAGDLARELWSRYLPEVE